jgi:hypothetical protein
MPIQFEFVRMPRIPQRPFLLSHSNFQGSYKSSGTNIVGFESHFIIIEAMMCCAQHYDTAVVFYLLPAAELIEFCEKNDSLFSCDIVFYYLEGV